MIPASVKRAMNSDTMLSKLSQIDRHVSSIPIQGGKFGLFARIFRTL
jgi:hypothetical protein